jgi:hypothetical protein
MYPESVLVRFLELFAGPTWVYAVGRVHREPEKAAIGKLEYFPVRGELTLDRLREHLDGQVRLGVYPIRDQQVRWFAIDFDGPKDADGVRIPTGFEQALADAEAQQRALATQGLFTYLERSQSGFGVHLWGFLDEWRPAAQVRAALAPLLLGADTADRMYPLQDELAPGKPGNLIAGSRASWPKSGRTGRPCWTCCTSGPRSALPGRRPFRARRPGARGPGPPSGATPILRVARRAPFEAS